MAAPLPGKTEQEKQPRRRLTKGLGSETALRRDAVWESRYLKIFQV